MKGNVTTLPLRNEQNNPIGSIFGQGIRWIYIYLLLEKCYNLKTLITISVIFNIFRNVGRAIGRIIALALDLNVDFFDQPEILGNKTASYSNMFHYGGNY